MTACRITLDDKDLVHWRALLILSIAFHIRKSVSLKKIEIESLDLPLLDQVELNKNDAEPMIDTFTHFSW